ncbi:ammonium transporter [Tieghemostelium lacteum]|uniref:Ammonium transporter n=1 Tax=Tieghemostelium lacteum TaxID=361077 RepID=A0A152A7A2_TIELA|nr:ammonium transporter [Tieghemostelium lacteum]|eukprot:KYR02110.1 ammonium transporter [Tieghemostelium lacteum]
MEYLDKNATTSSLESIVDDFWVLNATYLVFYMQAGFCLLEAGVVRAKNAKSIIIKSIIDTAIGSLIYWAIGFAFAFGYSSKVGNSFIGTSYFFLINYKNLSFFTFQWSFCVISCKIVSGSLAERVHINSCLIYTCVMSSIIHPIVSHWVWAEYGWLRNIGENGIIDFSGGIVVHVVGGSVGLVGAYLVGPRIGRFDADSGKPRPLPGHSITLYTLGAFIIWYGFYGFNTGSTLGLTGGRVLIAAKSSVTMTITATSSCATTLLAIKIKSGKYDVSKSVNGLLGGLVASAAVCAVIEPWAAFVIGCINAFVYLGGSNLLLKLRIDDPLDSSAIHFGCGIWGTLAVGFFSTKNDISVILRRETVTVYGLLNGGGFQQLGIQILGIVVVSIWCLFMATVLFTIMKRFNMLRIDPTRELMGIDMNQHGGPAYPNFQNV